MWTVIVSCEAEGRLNVERYATQTTALARAKHATQNPANAVTIIDPNGGTSII